MNHRNPTHLLTKYCPGSQDSRAVVTTHLRQQIGHFFNGRNYMNIQSARYRVWIAVPSMENSIKDQVFIDTHARRVDEHMQ